MARHSTETPVTLWNAGQSDPAAVSALAPLMTAPRIHLWVLLLAVALLVALFGWWGNTRLRATLQGRLKAELETSLNANVTALDIWVTNQTRLVAALASDPQLVALALERLDSVQSAPPERRRGPGPSGPSERVLDGVDAHLTQRLAAVGHEGILVSTNLEVVAASGRGRIRLGMPVYDVLQPKFVELFTTGKPVMITPFKPPVFDRSRRRPPGEPGDDRRGLRDPSPVGDQPIWTRFAPTNRPPPGARILMQVAAPIRDSEGHVRGALALLLDPEQEFSRILSVARFGDSGETYAFDSTGLMISRSRFDSQLRELGLLGSEPDATAALTLPLLDPGRDLTEHETEHLSLTNAAWIQPVAEALAGRDGVQSIPFRDYRGVPVVGAWQWLSQHDFGVLTQIDAQEAYQPLRMLRMLFLVLFLLLVFSANGFFLASYLGVGWRRRLMEAELKARRLGQYQLEEKIGEGGMGVVYRARHALLRRDTAIKVLQPGRADRESIERFEREVQLTCQLTHPNTVQVYDYGRTPEGLFYYAMEYLRGLNLKELVTRFGPQPEGRVVHIVSQVCDALGEAHQQGLVHRDIKPANIFLTNRGGVPDSVKVLDFGLVRQFRAEPGGGEVGVAETGLIGTPLFMSPESIRSPGRSDPRSDIYSMGALAYYLLTGRYVFEGANIEEVTQRHLHEAPESPNRRGGTLVSSVLEATILQCLEKEPARRPASVQVLKAQVQRSPHTGDWDVAARSAWWTRHEQEVLQPAPGPMDVGSAGLTEFRIDVTTRLA